jgi:hypothetical protein
LIAGWQENSLTMRLRQCRKWGGQASKMVNFLSLQQNIPQFDIAVIVLEAPSNRLADLKPLVPKILVVLEEAVKGQATAVSDS